MTAHIETSRASVLCLLLGAISAIGWWWGEAPLATSKPVVRVEAIDLSLDVAPPAEAAVTDRELSLPLIHPHAGGWPDRLAVIVVNAPVAPVSLRLGAESADGLMLGSARGGHVFRSVVGRVFDPPPGSSDPIEVRVEKPASGWWPVHVRVGTADALLSEDEHRQLIRIGLIAIIFGSMLTVFLTLDVLRTRSVRLFVIYWLISLTYLALSCGLIELPIWLPPSTLSRQLEIIVFGIQALFIRNFCDADVCAPRLSRMLGIAGYAALPIGAACPLLAAILPAVLYRVVVDDFFLAIQVFTLISLCALALRGIRAAIVMAIALLPTWAFLWMAAATVYMPRALSDFPWNSWELEILLIAWTWQVGFLLAAFAHRLRRLREERDQMEHVANNDSLTGLSNRAAHESQLQQRVMAAHLSGQPLALVFVDIDHFKSINDRHGHAAGDEVLSLFAKRLQQGLRESDIASRIGGEEFVLILGKVSPVIARQLVERLRQSVAGHPFVTRIGALMLTASFGIANLRPDDDVRSLTSRADAVMYRAKWNGRDRVECDDDERPAGGSDLGDGQTV